MVSVGHTQPPWHTVKGLSIHASILIGLHSQPLACLMNASASDAGAPEVICLQPVALVDHICQATPEQLAVLCGGSIGGSCRCSREQVDAILGHFHHCTRNAGGSAANTARGIATGFGIRTALVSLHVWCYDEQHAIKQVLR